MDRKYIQWRNGRNLGGRDGDKLKSVYGLFTWATVSNRDVIMLPVSRITGRYVHGDLNHMNVFHEGPQVTHSHKSMRIKDGHRPLPWGGVPYELFVEYRDMLMNMEDTHVVSLKGLPRVMPHKMYEWAQAYGQPEILSIYNNTNNWFRDVISSSFATNQVENTIQGKDTYTIAIHIRTGDIARSIVNKSGYNLVYYDMIMMAIKQACFKYNIKPEIQIHSICGSRMVKRLCSLHPEVMNMSSRHVSSTAAFKTFLDCDLFIPASSSLSTVACTIKEHGHVMLPHSGLKLKHYFNSKSRYIPQGHVPVDSFTDMVNSLERIFNKQ